MFALAVFYLFMSRDAKSPKLPHAYTATYSPEVSDVCSYPDHL